MSDDLSIPNPGYRGKRAGRYSSAAPRRRPGMDPDTKRLVMFAGAVGGVLALLIAASALTSRHSGQIPVVAADTSPIRIKPDNPGGMKVEAAENDVFSGGSDTKNARLAQAAEAPDTKALKAVEATPPTRTAPASGPLPIPPPPALPPATLSPAALPPPVAPSPSLVRPVMPPLPPAQAKAEAKVEAQAHAEAQAKVEAQAKDAGPETKHIIAVQLAAMTSEAAARDEWTRLSHRLPALFNSHTLNITKTERDGHSFWRLRTTGFTDVAQARGFCDQVRGKGGNCSVADF